MIDQDAARIDVNHCIGDSEIAQIEAIIDTADPGAWDVAHGHLVRHGGKPFKRPEESLRFAALARHVVPRLIKGLRVLEDVYATRCAEVVSLTNELRAARLDARATAERVAEGKTGPSWELGLVARYAALVGRVGRSKTDDGDSAYIEQLLRRWVGGESIGDQIRSSLEGIERRVKEREDSDVEQATADEARREEMRGWLRRLEAGQVPEEMAQKWAKLTSAARKRYLDEQR